MSTENLKILFPEEKDIPEAHLLSQPLHQKEYLVGGEIRSWSGPNEPVFSPVRMRSGNTLSKKQIGSFPLLTAKESEAALAAACQAYDHGRGLWPTLPVEERIRHLGEFVVRMKQKREEVVRLLMWEIGKSLEDSEKEFDRTVDYIVDTMEALKELDRVSSRFSIQQGILGQIRRAPLGVVLCMGPFNYPLNETFTTLIPALIMGNPVIFKPPKLGVLLHRPLLEAFRDAFPKGVVNTVYGDGATVVGPLMSSGKVDVLAFIGSCKVADLLKGQHPAPHRLRSVLGLGAKNSGIVLEDADLDLAVKECALGALSFNGQRCTALKLLFVHQAIAREFSQKLSDTLQKLSLGMPWKKGVQITPVAEPDKPAKLSAYVENALREGASVLNPGGGDCSESLFRPALIGNVTSAMKIYHEEQFGPVVPLAVFEELDQPVRQILESPYGQQVSLFGQDPDRLARLIDPLVNQVCRVNLNSQCQRGPDTFPFTGRKDSAEGTLSVSDALRVFSIRTLVAAKNNDMNRRILQGILRERKSHFLSTDFVF